MCYTCKFDFLFNDPNFQEIQLWSMYSSRIECEPFVIHPWFTFLNVLSTMARTVTWSLKEKKLHNKNHSPISHICTTYWQRSLSRTNFHIVPGTNLVFKPCWTSLLHTDHFLHNNSKLESNWYKNYVHILWCTKIHLSCHCFMKSSIIHHNTFCSNEWYYC